MCKAKGSQQLPQAARLAVWYWLYGTRNAFILGMPTAARSTDRRRMRDRIVTRRMRERFPFIKGALTHKER